MCAALIDIAITSPSVLNHTATHAPFHHNAAHIPVIVTNCDPTVDKLVGDDAFTVTFVTWNAFTYTNDIELLFCPATRTDAEYGTLCAMFDDPHRATLAVK